MVVFWLLKLDTSKVLSSWFLGGLVVFLLHSLSISTPVLAGQPVKPLPRRGGCPSDYTTWDDYCVPGSHARGAIDRIGSYCPSGFEIQGAYCLSFLNGREAIQKVGYSCPPDWNPSGSYCLRR